MTPDVDRLRALLGRPEAKWLRERLRGQYERTGKLASRVNLRAPTAAQREFVDALLGRPPTPSGFAVGISTEKLEQILRDATICDNLVEALRLLDGPLRDRKGEAEALARGWESTRATVLERIADRQWLRSWLDDLSLTGVLKRQAKGDPAVALNSIERAFRIIDRFPLAGAWLPALAAEAYGDAHALDKHQDLGLLVVRAAASYGGLDDWQSADGWRECWEAVGVFCDELSAPVLTLNVGGSGDGLTDRVLTMHAELGEACSLSLRQLVRHRPCLDHLANRQVFVCENPTIVAVAVERLGAACAPLVCTSGQPRGATRLLLREIVGAGGRLRVQADFDIDGLHIAGKSLVLNGARPWRMSVADYDRGQAGPALRRDDVPSAEWSPGLSAAMQTRGVGVHEESLLEQLLHDLDTATR
jgi:uncharacterized protein (TIGR02679 family)